MTAWLRRGLQTFAVIILAPVAVAFSQQAPAGAPSTAARALRDAEALAAINKMGAYLRTLQSFQVSATYTVEDVRADGQKIQYAGVTEVLAEAPSKLRAQVVNDRHERAYWYDGRTFTLWARRAGYYATVPAPPTIAGLIRTLERDFDIELPLVDLFRWGSPEWASANDGITAALDVGPSQVNGTTCQHYAFRQEGLDWQVWIQLGEFPLPRKLVLTTTSDEARPQYSVVYDWNLAPSFNDAAFVFTPPADAQRIVIAEVTAAPQ